MFPLGVIWIRQVDGQPVTEHGGGVFERNTVFSKIVDRLFWIPLKLVRHNYNLS